MKSKIDEIAKKLNIKQNVSIQVLDRFTGKVLQEVTGHNDATNSLLYGVAHHLIGDFMPNERHGLNPGYSMLSNYVPRYISLGTMGLINQNQDSHGLPAGIGDIVPSSSDPEYQRLLREMNLAKEDLDEAEEALAGECPYYPATEACESCQVCSDRISAKKQARDDAQQAYDDAVDAFMSYNEESRFVEYMKHTPGYGADGYSDNKNNGRKYQGLGHPFTSYDVTSTYRTGSSGHVADEVTYNGYLYRCIADTSSPAGPFDPLCWNKLPDNEQPSAGTTINLELISASYPRTLISYRDVVPESQAEQPGTIDVVYSAMISTGALAQFRPQGQDYIFITEAGLWSKKAWSDGNENGLLAGYRIIPPNSENWDMTIPENRQILKQNILKVGMNQVVQVVWKIQIGSIAEFTKATAYPFNDNIYYALLSNPGDYANPLNQLYVEKLPNKSATTSFKKSKYKQGCKVPSEIFDTQEELYLSFTMDETEQIIYWWTATGEVHYRTPYVETMFLGLNMNTVDLTGWYEYVRYLELEEGGNLLLEDGGLLLL